jgi:putative inorganic carbon (hco3(-)) transporter
MSKTLKLRQLGSTLADYELWIVGMVVLASMLKQDLLPIAVGVLIFFWLVRWIGFGRLSLRTPVDLPIIYILLMMPVTLWATALPDKTIWQVLRLMTGIGLFYAIVNWTNSKQRLEWLLFVLISGGLMLVAIAPFSVSWNTSKLSFIPSDLYERFVLIVQDTAHPNVMAGYLVIIFPISLSLFLFGWREMNQWLKIIGISNSILIPLTLILTQSRAAWIAMALVILLIIYFRFRFGWILIIISGIAGVVGIYILGINNIIDMISSSGAISGIDGRVEIWSRAIYMIQDFAFTGVGMGTFGDVADLLYPFFLYAPGTIPHAHNLFLQVAVDLGVMGLVAWLAIVMGVLITAWQLYKTTSGEYKTISQAIGVGMMGSVIALLEQGILDAVTWGMVRPAPIVWVIWGTCVAAWYVYIDYDRIDYKDADPILLREKPLNQ